MSGRMQDRVVVVTGGASGIGEGMVRRFCAEGARVLLGDVDAAAGERVATENGARYIPLDVRSEGDWAELERTLRADYGRLDALLNNAGIVSGQSVCDTDLATWDNAMAVNLTGVMLGCRSAIAVMRDNPGGPAGSIVNTASSVAYLALPGDAAYSAAKAAVVGLTKSAAVHCANEGWAIRVNSIHPGATLTNILRKVLEEAPEAEAGLKRMSPMNRFGTVEEVAALALFLASDEAGFCTGGQFPVEGGTVSEHPRSF